MWVSISIDPVEETLFIAGISESRDECKNHRERTDALYFKSFGWHETDSGMQMFDWFRKCGIPKKEAIELLNGILESFKEIMDD